MILLLTYSRLLSAAAWLLRPLGQISRSAPVCRLRFALLLGAGLLLFAPGAAAQQTREVDVVSADMLQGGTENGESVQELIGNVRLRQGTTQLQADRVVRYLQRDEILFMGAVRIVDEGDSLWAEQVRYDTRRKVGRAQGQVRLSDGDVVVRAPSGVYFVNEKRAWFDEGVTLVDSASTLRSRSGQYWTEEKRAEFYHEVQLEQDRSHLEADSVTLYRETEVAVARGNVFLERMGEAEADESSETATRTLLFGSYIYHDKGEDYSRAEGRPLLAQIRTDSTGAPADTLLVQAALLETKRTDALQRLVAVDAVRIWQPDLAATADSVVYDRLSPGEDDAEEPEREEIQLFRSPVAWFEQSQASGDTLRVTVRSGSIDSLFVRGRAFVAQLDTLLGRVQQLRGHALVGVFSQDSLRSLDVGPNAELIYYLKGENDGPNGGVQASGDRILFAFEHGELKDLRVLGGPQGTHYPEHLLPDPFQLEGYSWRPEARPTKAALLEDTRARTLLLPYVAGGARPSAGRASDAALAGRGGSAVEDKQ